MRPYTQAQGRPSVLTCALAATFCLLTACSSPHIQEHRFHLTGKVVAIDKAQERLLIDHQEIPGLMGAMTMPYAVADPGTLGRVTAGDEITADVVVTDSMRLDNVVVTGKSSGTAAAPAGATQQPEAGEQAPDFALVNQNGKRVSLAKYRGKAVLVTFIYTRCPLPDYCPLMSHNFAQIEKALAKTPDVYAKTHLLSISFDPKYDTPEVLRRYGQGYLDDKGKSTFDHWEFASILEPERQDVTKFFNLFYTEDQGQISHSMSTAIIGPDGNVYRWYHGNDWKPADVLSDLSALLANATQERSATEVPRDHL
jgi:protein SCO1/2